MRTFQRFATQHDDLIHDISYDYYGKRLATCSSDQQIKVWDQDDSGEWICVTQWKAHAGSVWKLAWAHPEFGQVIASCSFDRTVCIWEEVADATGKKKWIKKSTLVDSHDTVCDIKFSPRHLGLKLATCSADGFVRIYEAIDAMNLSQWPLMEEFQSHTKGIACLSWNPSPSSTPALVVGSQDGSLKVWEYNDTHRRWQVAENLTSNSEPINDVAWAPNMGRSFHLIATASKDQCVRIFKSESGSWREVACFPDHKSEVWRVEWNVTGTILASSGDDGSVRLWKGTLSDDWDCLSVISEAGDST